MKSFRVPTVVIASFLLSTAATLNAQLPVDSSVWRARCALLSSHAADIQAGKIPPALVAATRGLPGPDFYTMAVNRSQDDDHYVACTFYYAAAISERAGNSGKHDYNAAYNDTVLAAAELRLANHRHLTMTQHVKRFEMKVNASTQSLSLDAEQSQKIRDAGGTFPITLEVANDPLLKPVSTASR